MISLREAAAAALEAIRIFREWEMGQDYVSCRETVLARAFAAEEALEAALAEPDEPVAWRTFDGEGGYDYRTYDDHENYAEEWAARNPHRAGWVEPLYLHPAPQRQPLRTITYVCPICAASLERQE